MSNSTPQTAVFRKLNLNSIGFGELAGEIRALVYEFYFVDDNDVYPVVYKDGTVSDRRCDEDAMTKKLKAERGKNATSATFKNALLCVNKSISNECFESLYRGLVFNIVRFPNRMKTTLIQNVPQKMKNNIRELSLDILDLPFKISRLDSVSVVDEHGKYVGIEPWHVVAQQLPVLEILHIKCHRFLQARNLALRFAIKSDYSRADTSILFKLCIFGEVHERSVTPDAEWQEVRGPLTTVRIPPVKEVIIDVDAMHIDKEIIEGMTLNGKHLEFLYEEAVQREPFEYDEYESEKEYPSITSVDRTLRTYRLVAHPTSEEDQNDRKDEVDEIPGLRQLLNDRSAPDLPQTDGDVGYAARSASLREYIERFTLKR